MERNLKELNYFKICITQQLDKNGKAFIPVVKTLASRGIIKVTYNPILRRLKQKDHKFKSNLTPCCRNNKETKISCLCLSGIPEEMK